MHTAPANRTGRWKVLNTSGPAAPFHELSPDAETGPEVWIRTIPAPALVLGSTQPDELVHRDRAENAGIEVCRRRSGGGIVWIDPRTDCWIDVIVPIDSALWDPDVGRAFHWLGLLWSEVLAECGLETTMARASTRTPAGHLWCFADLGHGELAAGPNKIVGLSQRRTRTWARLQSLVLGRWPGADLRPYVDLAGHLRSGKPGSAQELDPAAVRAGFPPDFELPTPEELARRFVARLPDP